MPRSPSLPAPACAAPSPPATASARDVTASRRSSRARTGSSPTSALERLAAALGEGLRRELYLTPKPGLVDREDCGSHPDLTLALMECSAAFAEDHLRVLAGSLGRGEPLAAQVALGRVAERRMHAHFRTNTHRGAMFLGGVLLAARARAPAGDDAEVQAAVVEVARELEPLVEPEGTHGAAVRARLGVGGILREVGAGLPSVFAVGVPAYRRAVARGEVGDAPSLRMLASLMRTVEDTTALHRCGPVGLATLREDGARLEEALDAGCAEAFLRRRNSAYRAMNLTMGGVADLLGIAHGWICHRGGLGAPGAGPERARPHGR